MIKSLLDARITDGVPRVVSTQDWVQAMAAALGIIHRKTLDFADKSQIYTALDDVPEVILDALAVNWKIDWYDTGYNTEQKRRIIKSALTVRRLMGTVGAVKLQAEAIFPGTILEEWFEYGGTPGCFRLKTDLTEGDFPIVFHTRAEVEKKIVTAKRWSTHLEEVMYFIRAAPVTSPARAAATGLWETAYTPVQLPVPVIRPTTVARIAVVTGAHEAAAVNITLPI